MYTRIYKNIIIIVFYFFNLRFPDKVDNDVEGTIKLNVEATKNLATLAGNFLC